MGGIASVLNIAKEALQVHQSSLQVASHNVANADTPGFTRQSLSLTPAVATPSTFGEMGNGVRGEKILRFYDQFSTQRIVRQNSLTSGLEAQKETMRIIESVFNEAPGLALNELMSSFWDSVQQLSDNPEIFASRQVTVQQGSLLMDQFKTMSSEIVLARYDIGVSLDAAINDVNALTKEVANLNIQIATTETESYKANDLRDRRDVVVKELASMLDVKYFETSTGNYTVILKDGHSLVDMNASWEVDWADGKLEWISKTVTQDGVHEKRLDIGSGTELGGKLGGWLQSYNLLNERDPDSYAGRLNSLAKSFIREVNLQHSKGVGMTSFTGELTGTETAVDTAILTRPVAAATALETLAAGTIVINDRQVGKINGGIAVNGLAQSKTYNAVRAINEAITGVTAKLTTQVAGNAVTAMAAAPADNGSAIAFSINGVGINYTIDNNGILPDDSDQATYAANLAGAINAAMGAANMTLQAVVGDGTNGGAINAIVLRNTNPGDESQIIIADIDPVTVPVEGSLGLGNGIYKAGERNNTGEITLFSIDPFNITAGATDIYLDQLGWGGGGLTLNDTANDGTFDFSAEDGVISASIQGLRYADNLVTDGGGLDIWLYNSDNTLALAQPVHVALDRAYTLNDISAAINSSIQTATGLALPWLTASVTGNQLVFKSDESHRYAFANDTANLLQVAGINTLYTGHSAATIALNTKIVDNLEYLAAGTINDRGMIFRGDNSNALRLAGVQRDENISFLGGSNDTLDGYYNSLVSDVGAQGRSTDRELEANQKVTTQLEELRDSVSGVSLDEEMSNLMKYQHAYAAAAKLITAADELLQTLLQAV